MKRIAAAVGTLVLGVTMCTANAQAQESGRFTKALRPLSTGAATVARDTRGESWRESRVENRRIARSQRERVYERDGRYEGEVYDDRSWGKSAIIVGGSAATGAGIGGLLGGAKGALIGAAIGGGGAAIYEGTKQR
jgi:hypothetical protein